MTEINDIPRWGWMWILTGALWLLFKLAAFRREGGPAVVDPCYFAWVGTDTGAFRRDRRFSGESPTKWLEPVVFILAALATLSLLIPEVDNPIVVGWLGIACMLCLLHFGLFTLAANFWSSKGYPVSPIMDSPWKTTNLADFWGNRWNRAFSGWARAHVFRPLSRKFGAVPGLVGGFFLSGLAHELVISLPAGAGWGLPTLYFLIQAAGVLSQRGLHRFRGAAATLLFVLIPAPLLFHPAFLERVFAPMIRSLFVAG